jgi:hypothetical protein
MALPVYEMVINPEETSEVEVSFVALVDKPAIEKNFMAFKDQRLSFAVNEERRIISGPAMIADQLIYRKDENGEYNVFFSPETVRDIALKFFKKDYQKNLNLFHDPNLSLQGVTIFESFISDESRGIQPMKGFEDLPNGTWFISAKIENDEVWQAIKSGQVKGFSVEGIFSYMTKNVNRPVSQNSHFNIGDTSIMNQVLNELKAFKDKFFGDMPQPTPAAPAQLGAEVLLKDGTPVMIDKMEVGGMVTINGAPAPAGEHELQDGTKLTVGEGGIIASIGAATAEPAPTDYSSQFAAYEERLTTYESQFAEHTQAFQTLTQEFGQAKEQMRQLVEIVEKFMAQPSADTTVGNQNQFNSQKEITKEEKRKELASLFAKIKNK